MAWIIFVAIAWHEDDPCQAIDKNKASDVSTSPMLALHGK